MEVGLYNSHLEGVGVADGEVAGAEMDEVVE